MRKIVLLLVALMMLAGSAMASPVLCANAGLDVYQAAYTGFSNACQIGDKLFWNFTYSASSSPDATAAPVANETAVIPDPGDGVTNPGLIFSVGGFLVFPGESMTATITYQIATLSGSALIEDYSLLIAGSHTAQPNGQGTGSVTESFGNSPVGTPLVASIGPDGLTSLAGHVEFSPFVAGTTVTTLIQLQSPNDGLNDRVTISAIQEHFSETVPEPYESTLIGSGLLVLALQLRRARK
jgi:hypothetical protein